MAAAHDLLGRPLRDLRISVTDRCNFRCPYCMPKAAFGPDHPFLANAALMTADEIALIARAFVELGVTKIRLTGGEPLLRSDLPRVVAGIRRDSPAPEIALTTNGWFLAGQAEALRQAGLDRVNVSVDSLRPATAGLMNGLGFSTERVLAGIEAALAAGLPVKVNCVLKRGVNDSEILELCGYFRERGITLRFIEYMDVGTTNGWSAADVVPARTVVETVASAWPLEPAGPAYRGEVASRYRYRDGRGEIGIVSSVTEPFCRDCTRARLSADGRLHTCLFASSGHDLLSAVRSGETGPRLTERIARIWGERGDRYSDLRAAGSPASPRIEMSYIGG